MERERRQNTSTIGGMIHLEQQIYTLTNNLAELLETQTTNSVPLGELRGPIREEVWNGSLPTSRSDKTPPHNESTDSASDNNPFDQIPYDRLVLQRKEVGDYGTVEYVYQGLLGTYKLRIGTSITDGGRVFYIYFNNKLFLNLFPTRRKNVLVGKDEDEGEFYVFRFKGKDVGVFKRKYAV